MDEQEATVQEVLEGAEQPQETVEVVEVAPDLTLVVDALGQLQQTADAQLALLAILCGLVLGGVLALVMQRIWRQ